MLFAAVIALGVLSGAGCRSMIEMRLMNEAERSVPKPLTLSELYTEQGGYCFPGFTWGQNFSDFQRLTDFAVTDLEGYTENGETVYTAGDLHRTIFGRENDSGNVGILDDEIVDFVSIGFQTPETPDENTLSIAELSSKMQEELVRLFREPDETVTHSDTVNNVVYTMRTSFWRKEVNGRVTELQWGTATAAGMEDPSFASLGVAFSFPEGETNQ